MEEIEKIRLNPPFNEDEWLRLVFLLSDTQNWLNELVNAAMFSVPIKDRKKLFRKSYYITVGALTHIMERHYFKIPRHPNVSKFTIPVVEILALLRDANIEPVEQVTGTIYLKRVIDTGKIIGHDFNQLPTSLLTVLTDSGGRILTAFPGCMKSQTSISNL
ncbi:hypothetical protein [Chitinophaga filiformis]|uniref:Uncharacterized protein n=1 Tax=Chitinophaga filiformis TaxID=104663 RepID=A0ABY4I9U5_CHIFI|nr:hypothetical protein [Chitinophaga filiformis]UPK72861.1 hypothetical protein MYF79_16340 [Chitinophaga filiformis]